MSKKVEFYGREFTIDGGVECFAFIPEGESEAHIFAGNTFVGKLSDLKSYLKRVEDLVENAHSAISHEDALFDERVASSIKRSIKRGKLRI